MHALPNLALRAPRVAWSSPALMAATVGFRPAQPTMPVTHASASACAATAAGEWTQGGEGPQVCPHMLLCKASALTCDSFRKQLRQPCLPLNPRRMLLVPTCADALLAHQHLGLAGRVLDQLAQLRRLGAVPHADQRGLELLDLLGVKWVGSGSGWAGERGSAGSLAAAPPCAPSPHIAALPTAHCPLPAAQQRAPAPPAAPRCRPPPAPSPQTCRGAPPQCPASGCRWSRWSPAGRTSACSGGWE